MKECINNSYFALPAILMLIFFSSCVRTRSTQTLDNDAYVWQRRWGGAVKEALAESAPNIHAWRVLAAEADGSANWRRISIDPQALRGTGKPVVAIFRIDARRRTALEDKLARDIVAMAQQWRADGLTLRGIEVDYDCAVSQLPRYRDFLRQMRGYMDRHLMLSITALPSWLASRELPAVLAQVDESVLQVHSVMRAEQGLFERKTAYRWADAWSHITPVPFRIALPTYWSRVSWAADGRVEAIESELARFGFDAVGRELVIDPAEVNSLILDLRRARLLHLDGIAWFRLPTREDGRAWSSATWRAVMSGAFVGAPAPAVRLIASQAGVTDVYLRNQSALDTGIPASVSVSAESCEFADALPPYHWERNAKEIRFVSNDSRVLRAGEERSIGWVRCANGKVEGRVSF